MTPTRVLKTVQNFWAGFGWLDFFCPFSACHTPLTIAWPSHDTPHTHGASSRHSSTTHDRGIFSRNSASSPDVLPQILPATFSGVPDSLLFVFANRSTVSRPSCRIRGPKRFCRASSRSFRFRLFD